MTVGLRVAGAAGDVRRGVWRARAAAVDEQASLSGLASAGRAPDAPAGRSRSPRWAR